MASEFENIRQAQPNTRQERRQARLAELAERAQQRTQEGQTTDTEQSQEKGSVRKRRPKIRLIPIWFRLLIVTLLLLISIIAGLMVGYGVIGDGKASDVLKKSTWNHLVDLVEKDAPQK